MRKRLVIMVLSLNLIGFYFPSSNLTYANEEDIESRIQILKEEIKKEKGVIETLRKRYQFISGEKQRLRSVIEQEQQRTQQIEKDRQARLRRLQEKERLVQEQEKRQDVRGLEEKQQQKRFQSSPESFKEKRGQEIKTWLNKIEQMDAYLRKVLW